MKNEFYVYAYLRSANSITAACGTPYYIGKGKGRRCFECHKKIPVPSNRTNIVMLYENLSEEDSITMEKFGIAVFGRVDLGTGILRNRTNGGDGISGLVQSESHKRKRALALTGQIRSDRTKEILSKVHETKTYVLMDPDGFLFGSTNLSKTSRDLGLDQSNMVAVAKGRLKHHKGFLVQYLS